MSTTDEENLLKVLEIETNRISNLDSTLFTIKGWTVTLVSALVGFAFTKSDITEFTVKKELLILAIISTTIFMITDIAFRRVQLGHVEITARIKELLKERSGAINPNTNNFNVWERIWHIESNKKKNNRGFTQFIKDYLYILLLYNSVIISLLCLIFHAYK